MLLEVALRLQRIRREGTNALGLLIVVMKLHSNKHQTRIPIQPIHLPVHYYAYLLALGVHTAKAQLSPHAEDSDVSQPG